MNAASTDRRIRRTRAAIVDAFIALFLEEGYDEITVGAIVERAKVGRSTFYEHFRGKDEMLTETIRIPLEPLAASVDENADRAPLVAVLEHFWENRASARSSVGRESSRRAVTRLLAAMIRQRLDARTRAAGVGRSARSALVAILLAEAEIGTILAWTGGEIPDSAREMAEVIHGVAQSAALSLPGLGARR